MTIVHTADSYFKFLGDENRLDFAYNHPELGKIRKNLESDKFVSLSKIIVPNTMHYGISASGQETGEIRFINIENLTKQGIIRLDNVKFTDEPPAKFMLKENDILISRSRNVGTCAVVDENSEGSTFGSYIIKFVPKLDRVVPLFLAKFVNSTLGQIQTKYLKTGSTGNNINTDQILSIRVPSLSMQQQTNILNCLTPVEEQAIQLEATLASFAEKRRNLILDELGIATGFETKLENYWLFPKEIYERLDYVANYPLRTKVNQILDKANAVSFDKLIKDELDYGMNASGKEEGRFPFINIEQINSDGTIHLENMKYVDDVPSTKLLKKDDILICRSRAVGTSAIVSTENQSSTFGSYILRTHLTEQANISAKYIVAFLNSDLGRVQVKLLQAGSEKFAFTKKTGRGGGNNINTTQIKKIRVILPPENLREKIDIALDTSLKQLKTLKADKDKNWEKVNSKFAHELGQMTLLK